MASIEEENARYYRALHAMQSGVATEMGYDSLSTQPKHLRVGVNAAMCDHAALVKLLVDKGFISEEEYVTAIADAMEAEAARYEERIREHFGNVNIHLN